MVSADNKIKMERKGIPLAPFSFFYMKKKHVIAAILHQWQEYGFDPADTKRDWSTRRTRNYFHVETKEGRVFEIYQDVTDNNAREWFMTKEIVEEKS
jgi:hypothetical protein